MMSQLLQTLVYLDLQCQGASLRDHRCAQPMSVPVQSCPRKRAANRGIFTLNFTVSVLSDIQPARLSPRDLMLKPTGRHEHVSRRT